MPASISNLLTPATSGLRHIVINKNKIWSNGNSDARGEGSPPDNSDLLLQNLCRKRGAQSTHSAQCLSRRQLQDPRNGLFPRCYRNETACTDLSANQLVFRIACGIETTLIRSLLRCPVFVLLAPLLTMPPISNFQRDAAFRTAGE
ncbi:hypothetical protein TNCV_5050511 [Trichonephila clavipes]|nr:hypothetical protein TNCV_5050511 [Trichonephila clavipes]